MSEAIKSYKGFNKDMTCRGFQYDEHRRKDRLHDSVLTGGES